MERNYWGSRTKNLLKINDAGSDSCTLCLSPVFNTSIHFFSDSKHVLTGDSDLHDVISLRFPAAVFGVCAFACVLLSVDESVCEC